MSAGNSEFAISRAWSLALVAALGLHAAALVAIGGPQSAWHLMWSCHVATTLMAFGVAARNRIAVCAALLFHLGIGFPAWIVEVLLSRGTFGAAEFSAMLLATSVLVHLTPLAVGASALRGHNLTIHAFPPAWLLLVGPASAARLWTPRELNVNLAFASPLPFNGAFPRVWQFQCAEWVTAAITLLIALRCWNAWQRSRERLHAA